MNSINLIRIPLPDLSAIRSSFPSTLALVVEDIPLSCFIPHPTSLYPTQPRCIFIPIFVVFLSVSLTPAPDVTTWTPLMWTRLRFPFYILHNVLDGIQSWLRRAPDNPPSPNISALVP